MRALLVPGMLFAHAISAGLAHAETSGKTLPSVQPPDLDEADVDDETDAEIESPVAESESHEGGVAIGQAPATRYGKMSARACLREVQRRNLPVKSAGDTRGVPIPVRLTGELHGVRVHSGLPKSQRHTSPYEILDCRLALALDDFSAILARHEVVEVVHLSAYRPPPKKWPTSKPGKRHGAALALDAAVFVKKDGSKLTVEKNFKGHRHTAPCAVPPKASAETKELRAIFCEARDEGTLPRDARAQLQLGASQPLPPRSGGAASLVLRALRARRLRLPRMAAKKNSLVANINKRKKAGKSRPKSRSTVSDESYAQMEAGWPGSAKKTSKKSAAKKPTSKKSGSAKKSSAAKKAGAAKKSGSAHKPGPAKKSSAAKKTTAAKSAAPGRKSVKKSAAKKATTKKRAGSTA